MNAAERDEQLAAMLDRLAVQEKTAREHKTEAAARHDGPSFIRWASFLNRIRHMQERIESSLLAGITRTPTKEEEER